MKKLVTLAGVIVVILGIAAFNEWYRLYRITDLHTQMAKNLRQGLIDRGIRPISWELLGQTKGEFESVPEYPPAAKELAGQTATVAGYGIPLTGTSSGTHQHASMLPPPPPLLELFLGHSHAKTFRGVTEFILTPLPFECYWKKLPPLNQAIYVRTANPIEFPDGAAIAVTGTFELREQDGPKFFYVLQDAELVQ